MSLELHTYSDGGARGNPGPAAIGVVVCDANDRVLEKASRVIGATTNNVAEYNAMLLALELAQKRRARRLVCFADSELLVFQLQGRYRIKNLNLKALSEKVKSLAATFEKIQYRQVPREHPLIAQADKVLNLALDAAARYPHKSAPPPPAAQGELF